MVTATFHSTRRSACVAFTGIAEHMLSMVLQSSAWSGQQC